MLRKALFLIPVLFLGMPAFAQEEAQQVAQNPPIRPLAEILVVGRSGLTYTYETRHTILREEIERLDPSNAAEIVRRAPAAYVQTNSRGETLVFLRNAGERQVNVFFDGALMNIPWDNRVDLSLIPAPAIGDVSVASGVTSVEYGANTVGGAVNLNSRHAESRDRIEASLQYGQADLLKADGLYSGMAGETGLLFSAGHVRRDGLPLPGDADLPFNQIGGDLRTNTDLEMTNVLAGAERSFLDGAAEASLRFLYVDAEKGVAPEGNKDPALTSPRFWRYPDWKLWMTILSGQWDISPGTSLKGSVWVQSFDQTIRAFTDATFTTIDEEQFDENMTWGARLILSQDMAGGVVLASVNALHSRHDERQDAFTGGAPPALPGEELAFSENIISLGLEYEREFAPGLIIQAGGSVDNFSSPKTGDKPDIDDFTEWNLTLGGRYRLDDHWTVRAAAGRKTRFPTMRELFGQAINRFLINPDLQAESSWIGEVGIGWSGPRGRVEAVPFITVTSDTIDQRNVVVDGNRLRQRINLKGSRVYGLEVSGEADLTDRLFLAGSFTAMDVERRTDVPGEPVQLSEKPELIAQASLRYEHPSGVTGMAEILHQSGAVSLNDFDEFVPLEDSTALNLRLAYGLENIFPALDHGEIFIRADNVFDTVVEPQLGLPGAGRWVSGGLSLAF